MNAKPELLDITGYWIDDIELLLMDFSWDGGLSVLI